MIETYQIFTTIPLLKIEQNNWTFYYQEISEAWLWSDPISRKSLRPDYGVILFLGNPWGLTMEWSYF